MGYPNYLIIRLMNQDAHSNKCLEKNQDIFNFSSYINQISAPSQADSITQFNEQHSFQRRFFYKPILCYNDYIWGSENIG